MARRPEAAVAAGPSPEAAGFHSYQPSASTRQRRRRKARRKAGFSPTVSTRALIMRAPMPVSLAQKGTRPQWKSWMCPGSSAVMTGVRRVGAML